MNLFGPPANYEKMIGTARKKLFETGFFHIFGSNVINQLINFLSAIILVRILPKNEYGIYSYAYNIISFFVVFNGFGAASALMQMGSETTDKHEKHKVYVYSNNLGFASDMIILLILIVMALFVPLKMQGANNLLLLMSGLPIVILGVNLQTTYVRTLLKNKEYSYMMTWNTFLIFLFSVVGAFTYKAKGLVLGLYMAYLISTILFWLWFKTPLYFRKSVLGYWVKREFKKIAYISSINSGVSQVMYLLDLFVLGIAIPKSTTVASYKIATMIPTALTFIPSAVVVYVYPHFAQHKDDREWLQKNFKKLLTAMAMVNVCISLILVVFAPLIIRLFFGMRYLDAVVPFRILSLNYFFSGTFRTISGNMLVTQRELKFNLVIAICAGIMNVIADVWFIFLWGSTGAAIATFGVMLFCGIASTWRMVYVINNKKRANIGGD